MLLNLSNHPSEKWSREQRAAAIEQFGAIDDWAFPNIDPRVEEAEVERLAAVFFEKIKSWATDHPEPVVHLMGEMTFCYRLIRRLKRAHIKVVASTTERMAWEEADGKKTVIFIFVRFRAY